MLGNAYDARHCADCDHSFPVGTAVFLGAFALFGPAFIVVTETVSIKTGLEECEGGYIVRRNYGSSRLRLQDVARFEHTDARWPIVVAVRRDGARVPVPGLVEGRRTVWDGGQTYHIVDTLNEWPCSTAPLATRQRDICIHAARVPARSRFASRMSSGSPIHGPARVRARADARGGSGGFHPACRRFPPHPPTNGTREKQRSDGELTPYIGVDTPQRGGGGQRPYRGSSAEIAGRCFSRKPVRAATRWPGRARTSSA